MALPAIITGLQVWQGVLTLAYAAGTYIVSVSLIDPPLATFQANSPLVPFTVTLTSGSNAANTATYWLLNLTAPLALGSVISGTDRAFAVGDTAVITQQLIVPASDLRS